MLRGEKMDIVSHIKYNEKAKSWKIQSNQEHQLGVAKLASKFANEFDDMKLATTKVRGVF
jgi:hypothetical protein